MRADTPFRFNKGLLFIAASVVLSATAQLLMKLGTLEFQDISGMSTHFPWCALFWVSFGLACYGISMLSWMAALAKHELSFAYPMLSLSYILVYAGAVFLPQLHETASPMKTLGIVFIIIGVVLVSHTKDQQSTAP